MHITYRGDYALKTILELALHFGEEPAATIPELAAHLDIPNKFLEQILLDLKRGGFVESRRGKIGGYFLAKAPQQIRLGDIIRFIDGPIEPVACVDQHYKGCGEIKNCIFRNIWAEISQATSNIIDQITFDDLVKKIKARQGAFSYSI